MYGRVGLELLAIMISSYDGFSYFAAQVDSQIVHFQEPMYDFMRMIGAVKV